MHTAVSRDEKLPPNKKQDRAAKLPARFGRRDGLDGERHDIRERPLSFGGSSSEAGGRDTMRETRRGRKTKTRKKSGS